MEIKGNLPSWSWQEILNFGDPRGSKEIYEKNRNWVGIACCRMTDARRKEMTRIWNNSREKLCMLSVTNKGWFLGKIICLYSMSNCDLFNLEVWRFCSRESSHITLKSEIAKWTAIRCLKSLITACCAGNMPLVNDGWHTPRELLWGKRYYSHGPWGSCCAGQRCLKQPWACEGVLGWGKCWHIGHCWCSGPKNSLEISGPGRSWGLSTDTSGNGGSRCLMPMTSCDWELYPVSTVPSSARSLFPEGCCDCELPWLLSSSESSGTSDKICSDLLELCQVSAESCDLGCMPGLSIATERVFEANTPDTDSPGEQKCPCPSGSVYFDHKLLSGSTDSAEWWCAGALQGQDGLAWGVRATCGLWASSSSISSPEGCKAFSKTCSGNWDHGMDSSTSTGMLRPTKVPEKLRKVTLEIDSSSSNIIQWLWAGILKSNMNSLYSLYFNAFLKDGRKQQKGLADFLQNKTVKS